MTIWKAHLNGLIDWTMQEATDLNSKDVDASNEGSELPLRALLEVLSGHEVVGTRETETQTSQRETEAPNTTTAPAAELAEAKRETDVAIAQAFKILSQPIGLGGAVKAAAETAPSSRPTVTRRPAPHIVAGPGSLQQVAETLQAVNAKVDAITVATEPTTAPSTAQPESDAVVCEQTLQVIKVRSDAPGSALVSNPETIAKQQVHAFAAEAAVETARLQADEAAAVDVGEMAADQSEERTTAAEQCIETVAARADGLTGSFDAAALVAAASEKNPITEEKGGKFVAPTPEIVAAVPEFCAISERPIVGNASAQAPDAEPSTKTVTDELEQAREAAIVQSKIHAGRVEQPVELEASQPEVLAGVAQLVADPAQPAFHTAEGGEAAKIIITTAGHIKADLEPLAEAVAADPDSRVGSDPPVIHTATGQREFVPSDAAELTPEPAALQPEIRRPAMEPDVYMTAAQLENPLSAEQQSVELIAAQPDAPIAPPEPDIHMTKVDRVRAIALRWVLRDIKSNRLKGTAFDKNDLQALIEMGLVEMSNDVPTITAAGVSAIR